MKDYVLCAIDFSESSINALKWANRIALGTGATLAIQYSYRLIQTGKVADILSFKKKTEEECKMKFAEIEQNVFAGKGANRTYITEIGFYSDNIENFIRKNPATVIVLSETLAHSIYEHKNQTLSNFLKSLKVPLLVVPDFGEPFELPTFELEKQPVTGGF